jgi:hypothetical protein
MKLKCGVLLFAVFPAGLLAQSATVQMQCHTLASSGSAGISLRHGSETGCFCPCESGSNTSETG